MARIYTDGETKPLVQSLLTYPDALLGLYVS